MDWHIENVTMTDKLKAFLKVNESYVLLFSNINFDYYME